MRKKIIHTQFKHKDVIIDFFDISCVEKFDATPFFCDFLFVECKTYLQNAWERYFSGGSFTQ